MKKLFDMKAVFVVIFSLLFVVALLSPKVVQAATKKQINASVDVALERFASDVKGADEFLNAAKGVLVIPRVKQAGFVLGAKYGNGALRIEAKSIGYYNMTAASAGFQIGVQESNIILCFMDKTVLKKFRESNGWQAGVDGTVALVNIGAGGSIDTTKLKEPIVGFVFGQTGLMAGVSIEGLKLTRINPK